MRSGFSAAENSTKAHSHLPCCYHVGRFGGQLMHPAILSLVEATLGQEAALEAAVDLTRAFIDVPASDNDELEAENLDSSFERPIPRAVITNDNLLQPHEAMRHLLILTPNAAAVAELEHFDNFVRPSDLFRRAIDQQRILVSSLHEQAWLAQALPNCTIEVAGAVFPLEAHRNQRRPIAPQDLMDSQSFQVRVIAEGKPIEGMRVQLGFGQVSYVEALTDADGWAILAMKRDEIVFDLQILPDRAFWSHVSRKTLEQSGLTVELQRMEVNHWGFEAVGKNAVSQNAQPIRVGVIDTGVDWQHKCLEGVVKKAMLILTLEQGPKESTVITVDEFNEETIDFDGHGTHIAGLIAGQAADNYLGGLCQQVEVYSYRIFGVEPVAKDTDLATAIDQATRDGCEVVNISLGAGDTGGLQERIEKAINAGVVIVAASGNTGLSVECPAAYDDVLAVTALGQYGTFPEQTEHQYASHKPFAEQGDLFAPNFNNTGVGVDHIAPGVAITSLGLREGLVARTGTSMAAPFVTGAVVRLLQHDAGLRGLNGRARVQAVKAALAAQSRSLDFIPELQGAGLVQTS
jgi:subtilisin